MTGRAAELLEQAEANARKILAHCERQRAYLAPSQAELVDRQLDFIAATDSLALAASLRLALTVVEAAQRLSVMEQEYSGHEEEVSETATCSVCSRWMDAAEALDTALAAFDRAGADTNNETAE